MDITTHIRVEDYRNYSRSEPDKQQAFVNRISNDRGIGFERLIVKGCEYYRGVGRAIITKVPEPYRCIKKLNGYFEGIFTKQAEPDFKGVLRGGRAIVFEAKSTQKPKILQSVLTDRQSQLLDMQMLYGAYTYVCANIQDRYFMIPWQYWKDMKKYYARKYLMAADIVQFEVVFDGCVRFLEYKNGSVIGERL